MHTENCTCFLCKKYCKPKNITKPAREFWITLGYGGRPHLEEPSGAHWNKRMYDDQVYSSDEMQAYKPNYIDAHVIEHSAYLAVKQELESARAKYEELISYLPKVPTEPYERDLRKQLADANKKIEELKKKSKPD